MFYVVATHDRLRLYLSRWRRAMFVVGIVGLVTTSLFGENIPYTTRHYYHWLFGVKMAGLRFVGDSRQPHCHVETESLGYTL